jgi:predicted MPP superfamily phosphohydrolase
MSFDPRLEQDVVARLEQRLGRLHARLRLGLEADHEAQVFGQGINYFHFENLPWSHAIILACLTITGLYGRGRRNATKIEIRKNQISSAKIPSSFDGFSLLHLSDLHVDLNSKAMSTLHQILPNLHYDICVLTGDYRGLTFGPYQAALDGMASLCRLINKPMYGVLGNHDTIRMLPDLEEMGIRMLLNESVVLTCGSGRIHLAGVDDAHFYRADNLERAATDIPADEFSILLSHTPEIYRQAAHAEFDLMLSGHTHGGQICLPGQIAISLASVLPRRLGAGAWKYDNMMGYTSVGAGCSIVPARFNCPPEITIHYLRSRIVAAPP